jgi:hypothetical protein
MTKMVLNFTPLFIPVTSGETNGFAVFSHGSTPSISKSFFSVFGLLLIGRDFFYFYSLNKAWKVSNYFSKSQQEQD